MAQIISSSSVNTSVAPSGVGDAGNIQIIAQEILLEDESRISTSTFGQGNAGNINIFVEENVKLSSGSFIFSSVAEKAIGNGGQINIEANNIFLDSGSILVANTFGRGEGGKISLNASNSVNIAGYSSEDGFSSGIITATEAGGQGRAGNITVDTNIFSIADGAIVSSQTLNENDGGDIIINANTFEAVNGGQIVASADSSGNAGNINIHADNIVLSGRDPDFANRLTQFPNNVGNEAPGNSGFFASSRQDASGLGGDIEVTTGKLNIQEGAEINVSAEGSGSAGNLTINAQGIVLDRGILSAETRTGDKGSITLNNLNSLQLLNGSQITTKTTDEAKGGNITIGINGNLILQGNNNLISAQATDQANGGNVDIDADFIIAFPQNNDILASAIGGDGGKVQIKAESILGIEERNLTNTTNDINASSQFSSDGTISIETPDVDPASGLVELPDVPIDVSALLARNICDIGRGKTGKSSSFINTGRGGLPPNPYEPLESSDIFVDVQLPKKWVVNSGTNSATSIQKTEPIVEASAWIVNEKGNVELVSQVPSNNPKCGSDDVGTY